MSDFEYIYQQMKKAHYSGWSDEELRKCVDMLIGLTHEQLFTLYTSKWLKGDKVMRQEVFKCIYADKIGKREERIKNLPTDELLEEFMDKKSGNISLIRNQLLFLLLFLNYCLPLKFSDFPRRSLIISFFFFQEMLISTR